MTEALPELWLPAERAYTEQPPPRPRTAAAEGLRRLRERRIEPEAGRAAGGRRKWTPGGDDVSITTITPPWRYL